MKNNFVEYLVKLDYQLPYSYSVKMGEIVRVNDGELIEIFHLNKTVTPIYLRSYISVFSGISEFDFFNEFKKIFLKKEIFEKKEKFNINKLPKFASDIINRFPVPLKSKVVGFVDYVSGFAFTVSSDIQRHEFSDLLLINNFHSVRSEENLVLIFFLKKNQK